MATKLRVLKLAGVHRHFAGVRHVTNLTKINARFRDASFEKLMRNYSYLLRVIAVQDLILATPNADFVTIDFLNRLSDRLHLSPTVPAFLSRFPHIFRVVRLPPRAFSRSLTRVYLAPQALRAAELEAAATRECIPAAVERLKRLLSLSPTRALPLRCVFRTYRELGLPDDFEDSVIGRNKRIFRLLDNPAEAGTHIIKLVDSGQRYTTAVEAWRVLNNEGTEFSFKLCYPPGMKLEEGFRKKIKAWHRLPYDGPYDDFPLEAEEKNWSRPLAKAMEKRAVATLHEFLSLTVEKMIEIEKFSHFSSWFGIQFRVWDLVLKHPEIFYLSIRGWRNTVFLREAFWRGWVICQDPVYVARRKLFDLVALGRHESIHDEPKE